MGILQGRTFLGTIGGHPARRAAIAVTLLLAACQPTPAAPPTTAPPAATKPAATAAPTAKPAAPAAAPSPKPAASPSPAVAAKPAGSPSPASKPAAGPVQIPANKDDDLRWFYADGRIAKGHDALKAMQTENGLVLWLAGNQFFAMEDVARAFQKENPGVSVGIITLPPGLLLQGIQGGGVKYGTQEYRMLPDIYGSVNINHLRTLKNAGKMDEYMIYMHNELELMVAKGNPKNIKSMEDMVRPDVRTSNPNPKTEGIMSEYARPLLEKLGLWEKISAGKECESCDTTPNNWFTSVHHRETPERIRDGRSDTGIVWRTEMLEAVREGHAIEGVSLPPEQSLRNEVSYPIGILKDSPRKEVAGKWLAFLASPSGQGTYEKFGFVPATPEELKLKPIP